jgi:hypothetical protein
MTLAMIVLGISQAENNFLFYNEIKGEFCYEDKMVFRVKKPNTIIAKIISNY